LLIGYGGFYEKDCFFNDAIGVIGAGGSAVSVLVARCLEFPSIAAHGSSEGIALKEIKKAITASIKWMEEENEPIPEPLNEYVS
jgi:predicted RNase H-like HicB family nuclease